MFSPFSSQHNFTVRSLPWRPRTFAHLAPRQVLIRTVLNSCGAAAALTLERLWPAKGRKRLKALSSAGFMARHILDGKIKLNVFSLQPHFDLDQGLRQLAVAQLFVRLRECVPCYLTPSEPFPILTIQGRHFQVAVFRSEDPVELLLPFLNQPTVIICETLTKFPDAKARLTTDQDLIDQPLEECFYLPDGTPDRDGFFPRLCESGRRSNTFRPKIA